MKIIEITEGASGYIANFLGTCVNSFDNAGECIIPQLGYMDVTDFAQHEEDAIEISKEEFIKNVGNIDPRLRSIIGSDLLFLHDAIKDVYMIYDKDSDVHYFFGPSDEITEGASGYIPSNKEKNDPRFKMGLTVDIKPDSIQKNAKALGSKISRAGIPPQARTDGKI